MEPNFCASIHKKGCPFQNSLTYIFVQCYYYKCFNTSSPIASVPKTLSAEVVLSAMSRVR